MHKSARGRRVVASSAMSFATQGNQLRLMLTVLQYLPVASTERAMGHIPLAPYTMNDIGKDVCAL